MDCSAPEVLSGGVGAHSDSNDGGVGCCNTDVNDSDKKILFLRLLWSMVLVLKCIFLNYIGYGASTSFVPYLQCLGSISLGTKAIY